MNRANSGLEAALNQCIVQSLVSFKRTRIYHDNITAISTTDAVFKWLLWENNAEVSVMEKVSFARNVTLFSFPSYFLLSMITRAVIIISI